MSKEHASLNAEHHPHEQKASFFKENKNLLIAFSFIAFLLVLIIAYNIYGATTVKEGSTSVQGGDVGLSISTPPRSALGQEAQAQETYYKQTVDKSHNYGLFETKLASMGFFERNGETVFRADIWVHNVGKQTENFLWEGANIVDSNHVKYTVTSAVFDGSQIPSGGEREGYLIFSTVPTGTKGKATVTIGQSVGFSTVLGFTSKNPHIYEVEIA